MKLISFDVHMKKKVWNFLLNDFEKAFFSSLEINMTWHDFSSVENWRKVKVNKGHKECHISCQEWMGCIDYFRRTWQAMRCIVKISKIIHKRQTLLWENFRNKKKVDGTIKPITWPVNSTHNGWMEEKYWNLL